MHCMQSAHLAAWTAGDEDEAGGERWRQVERLHHAQHYVTLQASASIILKVLDDKKMQSHSFVHRGPTLAMMKPSSGLMMYCAR